MAGKILDGIKVVDFTIALAGPYSASVLKNLGADVVKVENITELDRDGAAGKHGVGCFFGNANEGKKSVTINMKTPEGKELFAGLVKEADVLIENFRPNALNKLGFSYEVCKELNPSIIYGSISGFGLTGDYWTYPGFDIIGQGMGGAMSVTGLPGREPLVPGAPQGDISAGINLAGAILAALVRRQKTGKGEKLEVALIDSIVAGQIDKMAMAQFGYVPGLVGNRDDRVAGPADGFFTKDRYVLISCETQKEFESLMKVMGREDLISDPRFAEYGARWKSANIDGDPLYPIVAEWVKTKTTEELEKICEEAEIPMSPVRDFKEMWECKQLHEDRKMFLDVPFSDGVMTVVRGTPVKMSEYPGGVDRAVSFHGEDNDAVFGALGYSKEQLAELREKKVIK